MATYYISPTGNDTTGDGSSGNPWATISKAHTSASSGDTIYCQDGTYTWVSQTFTKNLTIQAVNTGLAIFDGGGSVVRWITSVNQSIIGIVFDDATMTTDNPIFTASAPCDLQFTKCKFTNFVLVGIARFGAFAGPYYFTTPTGNVSVTFTSCLFNDVINSANGAIFQTRGNTQTLITFSLSLVNCVFYFSSSTSTVESLVSLVTVGTTGPFYVIATNTVVSNQSGNTIRWQSSSNPVTSNTLKNCLTYNMTSVPTGTNLIASDPQFIDPANDNFSLQTTSPAIAAGDPSA